MYENYPQAEQACVSEGSLMSGDEYAKRMELKRLHHSPTLAENIDRRIAQAEEQVLRLKRVKALLQEPAGMLNVPIDDLRFAMNY